MPGLVLCAQVIGESDETPPSGIFGPQGLMRNDIRRCHSNLTEGFKIKFTFWRQSPGVQIQTQPPTARVSGYTFSFFFCKMVMMVTVPTSYGFVRFKDDNSTK